jgi:hypothetical protein
MKRTLDSAIILLVLPAAMGVVCVHAILASRKANLLSPVVIRDDASPPFNSATKS